MSSAVIATFNRRGERMLVGAVACTLILGGGFALAQPDTPASTNPAVASKAASPRASDGAIQRDQAYTRWRIIFFWSLVILFVFIIAAGVIIRFSERFKAYLLRGEKKPTPMEDVWGMHKVPPDYAEETDSEDDEPPDKTE